MFRKGLFTVMVTIMTLMAFLAESQAADIFWWIRK